MEIEFDPTKDAADIAKQCSSLADAGMLDLPSAVVIVDKRADYGDVRYCSAG